MTTLHELYNKIELGARLTEQDALQLAYDADFLTLGRLANAKSKALHGQRISYLIDRNINYTNVCNAICRFCAFYRPKGHKEAWVITKEELSKKINETLHAGGSQILLQGGVHPDFKIDYYEDLLQYMKTHHPQIMIHAFSPPEIDYIAKNSNLSLKDTLTRLKVAGLNSIPGGGAEILVDEIRNRIAIGKCTAEEWLAVMREAHNIGLKTTSTMMFGHADRWEHRVEHLRKLRTLQDETNGFVSFIPWTFQPDNTALNPKLKKNADIVLATSHEYLRMVAIARLYLDNIPHLQTSNLTQGIKIGQVAINFGADDMGSIMLEENVVSSAGCDGALKLDDDKLVQAILETGHTPYQRDTFYNEIQTDRTQELIAKVSGALRYPLRAS